MNTHTLSTKIGLIIGIVLASNTSFAARVVTGNQAPEGQTFSFGVNAFARKADGSALFMGAALGATDTQDFGVSRYFSGAQKVLPLTPKTVLLNGVSDQENPLYDTTVAQLALMQGPNPVGGAEDRAVVVTHAHPELVYLINQYTPKVEVVGPKMVADAAGMLTSGVVGLAASAAQVFAAVKPTGGGNFGDANSGIAVLTLGMVEQTPESGAANVPVFQLTSVVPLDVSSAVVTIGADAASFTNKVTLSWAFGLHKMYAGIQATGGAGVTDGVRSLVVGTVLSNNSLQLNPIAPVSAFSGANAIVGHLGANSSVSINHLQTAYMSTGLPYLVIVGGNGTPAQTANSVYALPLVSGNEDTALNGTLANKNGPVETMYIQNRQFAGRVIKTPAVLPSELLTDTDAPARVGGGPLPAGPISDLYVQGDAVFVAVKDPVANQQPGLFYSQALFDENGLIKAWTTWSRALTLFDEASDLNAIHGSLYSPRYGDFSALVVTGTTNEVNTLKHTQWGSGDPLTSQPLNKLIAQELPQQEGGVQSINDFRFGTPGLDGISVMVATGLKKIVIAQTGRTDGDALVPVPGNEYGAFEDYTNGTITQSFVLGGPLVASISGGALDDIQPIIAAAIAGDGNQSWLFVGGDHGLAVLSDPTGAGWANPGLSDGLVGLVAGMSFKSVGSYSFIRKLIYDNNFLYVLTDSRVDRIDLTQGNPGLADVAVTTITRANELGFTAPATLLDLIVSQKCALLATSSGFLRIGNNKDIRTVTQTADAQWTHVPLPEGAGPAQTLFAVSKTGIETDVALHDGGIVYVLSAYRGKNEAYLFRFIINPVLAAPVSDTTVQRFPDFVIKDIPTYFMNFNGYKGLVSTNGALYLRTNSKEGETPAAAYVVENVPVPANLVEATIISAALQQSATGNQTIAGDFGLQVNE